jgi:phage terminase Nu1 subunit (DNA packaging protein)
MDSASSLQAHDLKPKTKQEIAEFLGVKPRSVERYMRAGLPFVKLGGVRFFIPDVVQYMRTKKTIRN